MDIDENELKERQNAFFQLFCETYETCWQEFYHWEPTYCARRLATISPGALLLNGNDEDVLLDEFDHSKKFVTPFDGKDTEISVSVGSALNAQLITSIMYTFPPSNFNTWPPYMFCLPISRNIWQSDSDYEWSKQQNSDREPTKENTGGLWFHFMPFSDEPDFQRGQETILQNGSLWWEQRMDRNNDGLQ